MKLLLLPLHYLNSLEAAISVSILNPATVATPEHHHEDQPEVWRTDEAGTQRWLGADQSQFGGW